MQVITIGIDVAKNVFQVDGLTEFYPKPIARRFTPAK